MLASAILPVLALAGAATAQEAVKLFDRQTQACSSGVHVIATAGGNSTDPYDYGLLGSLAQSIVAAIPGSDSVSMPYNKTIVNAAVIQAGEATFIQYINDYHTACPNGKIVLIGYSSGAIITMDGVCGSLIPVDQGLADSTIIATIVYGDQTRVAGQPYDLGTCTGNGNLTQVRNPALCGAFVPGIQSYCDTNDPQCCDGPPQDFEVHFVYPGKYDSVATQFVVSRWNLLGGGSSVSSSSSSSSTSTSSSSSSTTKSVASTTTSSSSSSTSSSISVAPSTSASPTVLYSNTTSIPLTTVTTKLPVTTSVGTTSTARASSTLTPANPNGAQSILPSIFPLALTLVAVIATFC